MKNSTATIKRLTKNDSNIAVSTAKVFYDDSISIERAERFLNNPSNYFLVAFIDDKVAGFVMGYQLDSWHKDVKEMLLFDIEVLNEFRRHGIGTKLIEALKDSAIKDGFEELWLPTNKSNKAAVEFYKRTGGVQKHDDDTLFTFVLKNR